MNTTEIFEWYDSLTEEQRVTYATKTLGYYPVMLTVKDMHKVYDDHFEAHKANEYCLQLVSIAKTLNTGWKSAFFALEAIHKGEQVKFYKQQFES